MENIRESYAQVNKYIKERLKRKQVNIPKIMELYSEGVSEDNIRILHRITQEELGYILRNYMTLEIIKQRKESKKRLDGKVSNLMGLSKKQQKEDNEILSIEEALALFE